ncbi:orotate phosphoribosyltransferase [Fructilactobacillus florum]|uniref:Orotate phosphoribosyltransferase n=1 Tax=Fructilactobacillus florum DSM 22689 = JCM 16035 TaxID=1423745 RepID=A0A0R2CL22_9LACO|nr:orotate phosphoribosyltransferase [Fructilactobacillus florum]KRM92319.1 orotate phosphoribosyltransferase [Fructilactobacillus florum DSM 22689 = JCM 16035]
MSDLKSRILQQLVEDQIIKINPNQPFHFASGIQSPVYTDLRLTISNPSLRTNLAQALTELVQKKFPAVSVVGGVATAGIPQAALIADRLQLPLIYVRSKPKDHGTGKMIEGRVQPTDQVVLLDDLISTGGSVLRATQAVQQAGMNVLGVVSIFSYGFPDAHQNFTKAKTPFYPLLTYPELIKQATADQLLTTEEAQKLQRWHQNPWDWPLT